MSQRLKRSSTPRRRKQGHSTPKTATGPDLAPLDALAREIQAVLDLVKPMLAPISDEPTYNGYCGVATEAYLHLAGGRDSGLQVKRADNGDETSHWWLEGPDGVIDLMYSAADRKRIRA